MSDRDVPFEEDAVCDCCGKEGAFDFMGDFLCSGCFKKLTNEEAQDETI